MSCDGVKNRKGSYKNSLTSAVVFYFIRGGNDVRQN